MNNKILLTIIGLSVGRLSLPLTSAERNNLVGEVHELCIWETTEDIRELVRQAEAIYDQYDLESLAMRCQSEEV